MARRKNLIDLLAEEERLVDRVLHLSRRLSVVRDRRRRLELRAAKDALRAQYDKTGALRVPCTSCDVGPGALCLSGGKTRAPHEARVAAVAGPGWVREVSDERADDAFHERQLEGPR